MSALFVADSAEAKSTAIDDLGRPHPHFIVGREGGAKFDRSRRAFRSNTGTAQASPAKRRTAFSSASQRG